MKQEVKSFDDKVLKEISLDKSIFGLEPKETIIHRMIRYQLSKKRSGNHKTKGISEISGTTKKPFKQKGIFDKETADKLKKYVYSAGNTDDLMTQYVRYRGSEPKIESLLEKRGLDEF